MTLDKYRTERNVPPLWEGRFGPSFGKRLAGSILWRHADDVWPASHRDAPVVTDIPGALQDAIYGFGNLGEVTLPASTGILPWLFVGGLAPAAVAVARDGTVAVFDPRPDVEKYVELARSCRA